MSKNVTILSAYGSHNAAVSLFHNGKYEVVEVERWINSKNAGLTTYLPSKNPQVVFDEICKYLLEKCNNKVDVYMHSHMNKVKPNFEYGEKITYDHHMAHAACAFYQTDYTDSIVFTYDGGGDNGFFNVYHASQTNGIRLLEKFDQDLGFAYMIIADYLSDIKKDPLNIGNLVYAGKLMGLCSYGQVRQEWIKPFNDFYEKFNYKGNSYLGGAEARYDALTDLMDQIGVEDFDMEKTRISGQKAWDMAATTQFVFEQQFYKFAQKYLDEYDYPICLSGGCALNVLLNARLLEERKGNVFVPPNTSDCGISIGGLLWYQEPAEKIDLTYAGLPIMDTNMLSTYLNEGNYDVKCDVDEKFLADYINKGNIVGILNGNSEHGPRALGNRSIICSPRDNMKDVINKKVKNREWYRPFAPVVRHFETNKYFHFDDYDSRHMTYVAVVRDEWKETIPAVTHNDGTGRLQTVRENENKFLYNVLTEYEKLSGCGVLLNTSFNVDGKPILSRISDAFEILNKTQLDAIYYDGKLISKEGNIPSIHEQLKDEQTNVLIFLPDEDNIQKCTDNLISSMTKNCVIVVDEENVDKVSQHMLEDTKLFIADYRKLYYTESIERLPDESFEKATSFFKKYIKWLWVKDAVKDNKNYNQNQLIVDLSKELLTPHKEYKSEGKILFADDAIFGNVNELNMFFMMVEHAVVKNCERKKLFNDVTIIEQAKEVYKGNIGKFDE